MNNSFKITKDIQVLKTIKKTYSAQNKTRYELISLYFFLRSIDNPNFNIYNNQSSLLIKQFKKNNQLNVIKREKPDFATIECQYGIEIIQPRIKVSDIPIIKIEDIFWQELKRGLKKHLESYKVNYLHEYLETHFVLDMRDFGKYHIYHNNILIADLLSDYTFKMQINDLVSICELDDFEKIYCWILIENNCFEIKKYYFEESLKQPSVRLIKFEKQNRINPRRSIK